MYYQQSAADVLQILKSSQEGLKKKAIEMALEKHGYNELPQKKKSRFLLFCSQFNDVLVYILFVALGLSIVTPLLEAEVLTFESFLDALVITAILLLNAILGFVQEYRAEEAIEMLQKLTSPHARVRRGGTEMIVPSRELVPGDIVIVEAGDKFSADGRLLIESHLQVNESSMTGESNAIDKTLEALEGKRGLAEQTNMVFSGTLVTRGSGEYVVTATGVQTEIGKIAKMVSDTDIPETPLQIRMQQLGKLIGLVVVALCVFVVFIGLFQGLSAPEILLLGVSLAVSAVPEGLPAVVTVCLAMGVRRMVTKNALVRRLDSLEALGSVTVICADKTGTITENRMRVVDSWLLHESEDESALLAQIASSCNRAYLPNLGDPTEIGLLEHGNDRKVKRLEIDDEEVPFTSEEKYMQTRHGSLVFLKGAPEKILELCGHKNADVIQKNNDGFAADGLRVLGCAVKEKGEANPRFVGLIALEDPPRETAASAIAQAKQAGIRTIMITGDNIVTAQAIAHDVGIEGEAMMGDEIDALSVEQLAEAVKTVSVFARVSPTHKVAILSALKMNGEIVAMSGDGVNDAPALKGAHVGIAMGKNGTEVAREAASIVLADDHYATIVEAIKEGRRIYDNIRKFVLFLLRANFDELLLITTTLIMGIPVPYLPIHILWINLMTDGLPALALGMEPAEKNVMNRPPRSPNEHILSGEWGRLTLSALWAYAVAFLFFLWELGKGVPLEEARTSTLTLAIFVELLMAFTTRSRRPIWEIGFFSNKWLLGAVLIPLVFQVLLVFTPFGKILHFVPMTMAEWLQTAGIAIVGFLVFESLKLLPNPTGDNTKVSGGEGGI